MKVAGLNGNQLRAYLLDGVNASLLEKFSLIRIEGVAFVRRRRNVFRVRPVSASERFGTVGRHPGGKNREITLKPYSFVR